MVWRCRRVVDDGRRPSTLRLCSLWSRLYGFGSIYAKTLRDSRLSFIIIAGLLLAAAGLALGGRGMQRRDAAG